MTWLDWLKEEAGKTSRAAVGRKLGVSRTTISLVLDNKYPADGDNIKNLVEQFINRVYCSFLDKQLTINECKAYSGEVPTSSPTALRLWKACQQCEFKPKEVAYDSGKTGDRFKRVKTSKSRANIEKLSGSKGRHRQVKNVN